MKLEAKSPVDSSSRISGSCMASGRGRSLLNPPTTAKKPKRKSRVIHKKSSMGKSAKKALFRKSMKAAIKKEVNVYATPKGSTCLMVRYPPGVQARKSVLQKRAEELFVDFESEF